MAGGAGDELVESGEEGVASLEVRGVNASIGREVGRGVHDRNLVADSHGGPDNDAPWPHSPTLRRVTPPLPPVGCAPIRGTGLERLPGLLTLRHAK